MPEPINYIPEGFHTVTPYLTVKDAAALLDFLKHAFDATVLSCTEYPAGHIAHAAARIGDSVIELSEASDEWPAMPCALHMYVPDTDAVYRRAIEAGGAPLFEPMDQIYGERGAAVKDPAGNNWYIATIIENVSEEEIARRVSAMESE